MNRTQTGVDLNSYLQNINTMNEKIKIEQIDLRYFRLSHYTNNKPLICRTSNNQARPGRSYVNVHYYTVSVAFVSEV